MARLEAGGVGALLTDNIVRQTDNLIKPALLGKAGVVETPKRGTSGSWGNEYNQGHIANDQGQRTNDKH